MAIQDTKAAAVESDNSEATSTFDDIVNAAVADMKKDESGKYILPDGLSEEVQYAANSERRRRDTQSALSKTQQQLKAEETMNAELVKRVTQSTRAALAPEEVEELEALKYSDPDAWRAKANELDNRASITTQTELTELSSKASQQAELEYRQALINQFIQENPDTPLTDEAVVKDIPPRITSQLETGDITFAKFLNLAHAYLTHPKTVGGVKIPKQPNMNLASGGSTPGQAAVNQDAHDIYQNATL